MTPGLPQLRSRGVGELLDAAFRLYRRNFFLFVGIAAVVYIPLTLLQIIFQIAHPEQVLLFGDVVSTSQILLAFVSFIAVAGLMNGAMIRAISDRYLGRSLGLFDTYRALGWRWLRLVGGLILVILIDMGLALFSLIPCLGQIAGLILFIYINAPILAFLAPVIVVEDKGAVAGLRRAFDLGRRRFWRLLGIYFLLLVLGLVIWVAMFVLLVFALTFLWYSQFGGVAIVIYQLLWMMVIVLIVPVGLCTMTLFYFDLRIRFEGFDLDLMMEQMGAGTTSSLASREAHLEPETQRHLERAYAYEEQGEFENALRECELAIQLAPGWAEAHNLRGVLLEELGQTEKAIQAYREAVRLAPAFLEARENLAEAEAELREKGAS